MEFPLARLKAALDQMPPTARRIAGVIIEQPDRVTKMSVSELAAAAQASEGSVIGLCQQIGASGFPELKIAIAKEVSAGRALLHEDVGPADSVSDIVKKIAGSHMLAIEDTTKVLDESAIDKAVTLMAGAQRIEFYGIGTAAPIAEDAAYRFLRLGLATKSVTDSHAQAISAAFTGPSVTTVTISHSGRTQETLTSTRLAKEAGAHTICITNYGKSPLHEFCDVAIHTAARETRYRMEALSSRIAQMVVVDILYARLAVQRWGRSLEAIRRSYDILATKRLAGGSDT
jgi:DNA-binding MurR/RpiR family transcriptional regulator